MIYKQYQKRYFVFSFHFYPTLFIVIAFRRIFSINFIIVNFVLILPRPKRIREIQLEDVKKSR